MRSVCEFGLHLRFSVFHWSFYFTIALNKCAGQMDASLSGMFGKKFDYFFILPEMSNLSRIECLGTEYGLLKIFEYGSGRVIYLIELNFTLLEGWSCDTIFLSIFPLEKGVTEKASTECNLICVPSTKNPSKLWKEWK